jgi:hypothetical protein
MRIVLAILILACACGGGGGSETPPAPAAPAAPPVDREQMMREAAERVKAEREKVRNELRAVGVGGVKKKTLLGKVGDRKLELEFEFENKGQKLMRSAEGTVFFRDKAGTGLKQIKVPFSQEIPPGKSVTKTGRFPLDQASENDKALATTDLKDLTVEWVPTRYVFEDGTDMRAE